VLSDVKRKEVSRGVQAPPYEVRENRYKVLVCAGLKLGYIDKKKQGMKVEHIALPMLLAIGVTALLAGCKRNCGREFKKQIPWEELRQTFDLDEDGISDLHRCDMLVLSSGPNDFEERPWPVQQGLCGNGVYEFLVGQNGNHFLQPGERIELQAATETELEWRAGTYRLLANQVCEGLYEETWTIDEKGPLPHYMAIKREDSTGVQLGWIALNYDLNEGKMAISQTYLSTDSVVVFE